MAQNKEQLNKLLWFIKRLIDEPGNEDFVDKLRKMLGETPLSTTVATSQLTDIKKYLGLDYQLDSVSPVVDYTFVDDDYIRNQLESDFREMLRYRYGVRSHKVDFLEFCRYAIMQVEQILNFFYQQRFSSFEEVKKYVVDNVNWARIENIETIASLSFAIKLSAFMNNDDNMRKIRGVLDFAREVRNTQSHRGVNKAFDTIANYRAYLEELGLPLTKEGEVYWNGIIGNDDLKVKYDSLDKAEYWNYRFQLWLNREPFDEVVGAIQVFTQYIKEDLGLK